MCIHTASVLYHSALEYGIECVCMCVWPPAFFLTPPGANVTVMPASVWRTSTASWCVTASTTQRVMTATCVSASITTAHGEEPPLTVPTSVCVSANSYVMLSSLDRAVRHGAVTDPNPELSILFSVHNAICERRRGSSHGNKCWTREVKFFCFIEVTL